MGSEFALRGTIRVPGDKSIAHRALFFAAQAQGVTRIAGLPEGADVAASLRVLESLGAGISVETGADGTPITVVEGWGSEGPSPRAADDGVLQLNCGNSGTTARFLLGMLAGYPCRARLEGDASLRQRPMRRLIDPLKSMGLSCLSEAWPIEVVGTKQLRPIAVQTPVASAQMKTALLFAALQASGESLIAEPFLSRDHTERMAEAFKISLAKPSDGNGVVVRGPQIPRAPEKVIAIPGDPSSAAFWVAAALCIPGSDLTIEGVCINPTRMGFVRALQSMGASISVEETGSSANEPVGTIHIISSRLAPCRTSAADSAALIDEVPLLALACAFAQGESRIANIGELRYKECDRLEAIIKVLESCGVHAEAAAEGESIDLVICGNGSLSAPDSPAVFAYRDHRIAMMWAVAAAASRVHVRLSPEDIDSIAVSYPGFLDEFSHRLGYAPIVCIE